MGSLKDLQSLDLRIKIEYTKGKIEEFVEYCGGIDKVYISFSGGKDSTVLCDIANKMYPGIKMVFVDTGLEFPEIKEFVDDKKTECTSKDGDNFEFTGWNIETIRPKMTFVQVIKKYGYPVISKEQSQYIDQWRNAKSLKTKWTRWIGNKYGMGKISNKWKKIAWDNNFKISDKCCNVMKKKPAKDYEKKTGRKPIIGTMASESKFREQQWKQYGCNAFDNERVNSKPLSIWLESDIWQYIKENNIEVAKPYTMGYERTGCVFCAFGCHLEKGMNRFQRLEVTHPGLHNYVINKLGFGKVLDEIGVEYRGNDILLQYDEEEKKRQGKMFG